MSTPKWTREEAVQLCTVVESVAPQFGAHVALTGGLLYKDGPRKDCDILLYRIRQRAEPIDFTGLFNVLSLFGIKLISDHGWVKKVEWNDKKVDLFDPEATGDHHSGGTP